MPSSSEDNPALRQVKKEFGELKTVLEDRARLRAETEMDAYAQSTEEAQQQFQLTLLGPTSLRGNVAVGERVTSVTNNVGLDSVTPILKIPIDPAAPSNVISAQKEHNTIVAHHNEEWKEAQAAAEATILKVNIDSERLKDELDANGIARAERDMDTIRSSDVQSNYHKIRQITDDVLDKLRDENDDSFEFDGLEVGSRRRGHGSHHKQGADNHSPGKGKRSAKHSSQHQMALFGPDKAREYHEQLISAQMEITELKKEHEERMQEAKLEAKLQLEAHMVMQKDNAKALEDENGVLRETLAEERALKRRLEERLSSEAERTKRLQTEFNGEVMSLQEEIDLLAKTREEMELELDECRSRETKLTTVLAGVEKNEEERREQQDKEDERRELELEELRRASQLSQIAEERAREVCEESTKTAGLLRSSLEDQEKANETLRHQLSQSEAVLEEVTNERNRLTSQQASTCGELELVRHEFMALTTQHEEILKELNQAKTVIEETEAQRTHMKSVLSDIKRLQRDVAESCERTEAERRRKMDYVCKTFVLRAQVRVLDKANAKDKRIQNLMEQCEWLHERIRALTAKKKKAPIEGAVRIRRAPGDEADGDEDFAIADKATQAGGSVADHPREMDGSVADGLSPSVESESLHMQKQLAWKSVAIQVDPEEVQQDEYGDTNNKYREGNVVVDCGWMNAYMADSPLMNHFANVALDLERRTATRNRSPPSPVSSRRNKSPQRQETDTVTETLSPQQRHQRSRPRAVSAGSQRTFSTFRDRDSFCSSATAVRRDDMAGQEVVQTDAGSKDAESTPSSELLTVAGTTTAVQDSAIAGNPCNYHVAMKRVGLGGILGLKRHSEALQKRMKVELDPSESARGKQSSGGSGDVEEVRDPSMLSELPSRSVSQSPLPRPFSAQSVVTGSTRNSRPGSAAATSSRAEVSSMEPVILASEKCLDHDHSTSAQKHDFAAFCPHSRLPRGAWKNKAKGLKIHF